MSNGANQRVVSQEDFKAKVADVVMATGRLYADVEKEFRDSLHKQGQIVEDEEDLDFSAGNPAGT